MLWISPWNSENDDAVPLKLFATHTRPNGTNVQKRNPRNGKERGVAPKVPHSQVKSKRQAGCLQNAGPSGLRDVFVENGDRNPAIASIRRGGGRMCQRTFVTRGTPSREGRSATHTDAVEDLTRQTQGLRNGPSLLPS